MRRNVRYQFVLVYTVPTGGEGRGRRGRSGGRGARCAARGEEQAPACRCTASRSSRQAPPTRQSNAAPSERCSSTLHAATRTRDLRRDRPNHRSQGHSLARLPAPGGGLRRARVAAAEPVLWVRTALAPALFLPDPELIEPQDLTEQQPLTAAALCHQAEPTVEFVRLLMARLYAATGDGIARLDEAGEAWTVELALRKRGAVPRRRPGRPRHRLRRSARGRCAPHRRRRPKLGRLRAARAGRVLARGERGRRGGVCRHRAEPPVPKRRPRRELARARRRCSSCRRGRRWSFPPRPWTSHVRWIAPSPLDADLLLVGIELGGLDALDRRRADLAGPSSRRAARCALARLAPARAGPGIRGGRWRRRLEQGRGRDLAAGRRGPRPSLHRGRSPSIPTTPTAGTSPRAPGPFAAHGRRDPQARIYRRRDGQAWQSLGGGLPEPLPAMPYALLAADGRLFAGLADGQLWESRDRGDTGLRFNSKATASLRYSRSH